MLIFFSQNWILFEAYLIFPPYFPAQKMAVCVCGGGGGVSENVTINTLGTETDGMAVYLKLFSVYLNQMEARGKKNILLIKVMWQWNKTGPLVLNDCQLPTDLAFFFHFDPSLYL